MAFRLVVVFVVSLAAFGCKSSEEQANEDAMKSRDAQAAQMGGHGGPTNAPKPGATPPSSSSASGGG